MQKSLRVLALESPVCVARNNWVGIQITKKECRKSYRNITPKQTHTNLNYARSRCYPL